MDSKQKRVNLPGWSLFLALALIVNPGCGSGSGIPLSDVSGVVTFNGAPVEGAGLRFSPKSGERTSTGQTDADGKYRMIFTPKELGAVIGEHEVVVQYKGKLLSKEITVENSRSSTIDIELNEFSPAK